MSTYGSLDTLCKRRRKLRRTTAGYEKNFKHVICFASPRQASDPNALEKL